MNYSLRDPFRGIEVDLTNALYRGLGIKSCSRGSLWDRVHRSFNIDSYVILINSREKIKGLIDRRQ